MSFVVDASVVLGIVLAEGGFGEAPSLSAAAISSVNLCEVLTRMSDAGVDPSAAAEQIALLQMESVQFDERHAILAAELRPMTRHLGLSLGDRACLALAKARGLPVLTADRAWAQLELDIDIRVVR
jgi:PIN domain nuclease of toxin-antitoxin system